MPQAMDGLTTQRSGLRLIPGERDIGTPRLRASIASARSAVLPLRAVAGPGRVTAPAVGTQGLVFGPLSEVEAAAVLRIRGDLARGRARPERSGHPAAAPASERFLAPGPERGASREQVPPIDQVAARSDLPVTPTKLSRLSPDARLLLRAAAVVGDPFELDLAADGAAASPDDLLPAVDELFEAGLIEPTDTPRCFRFGHPTIRQAGYESAGLGWRLAAHRRVAASLAARGAPAAARAEHVVRCSAPGEEDAIEVLVDAAESVAGTAPATAARWFAAALRLLPESPEAALRRSQVRAGHAMALASAGRLEEAYGAMTDTLAHLPDEEAPRSVRLTACCAAVENLLWHHDEARSRLHQALSQLRSPRSPEAATLQLEMARTCRWSADFEGERRWAVSALELADRLGETILIAAASLELAHAEHQTGDIVSARHHLEEGRSRCDALDDDALVAHVDVAMALGYLELFVDELDAAIRHFDRAISLASSTGQDALLPPLFAGLARAYTIRGQLAEAADAADAAAEAASRVGTGQARAASLGMRSWIRALQGDVLTALGAARECLDLLEAVGTSVLAAEVAQAAASALVETGEADNVDLLVDRLGGPELPLAAPTFRCAAYETLTRAELSRGDTDAALDWSDRAQQTAASVELPVGRARAGIATAEVGLATGDTAGAAKEALAAAELAASAGARIDAARARMLAGRALARLGERAGAVAELSRAADAFAECETPNLLKQVSSDLRRLGRRRPAARKAVGLPSLSTRELEVARLVTAAKTNREIATALFVSQKTVETHLAHIFAKLGVKSRAEVARLCTGLARRDGEQP